MDEFDERLAAEVRKHRRLYDNACPSRKNSKATTVTWRGIGDALDEDPSMCMRRWKALRDKFVRLKKRLRTTKGGPPAGGPEAADAAVAVHVIHNKLSWLNEHVTHRAITNPSEAKRRPKPEDDHHLHDSGAVTDMEQSSEAMPIEAEECDQLDESSPPTRGFKRQLTRKRKTVRTDNTADDVKRSEPDPHTERPKPGDACDRYTQTVADFMRGLSRRRCVIFKKRLNDLMYEMDLEELDDFAQS
ncbi:hypothetical protein NHX12_026499 [Muraenolepis orangiensis]|uniref:MADF domain-containing protein n=1 Tax=Muraenolepis orangiensis TaxID=630683 RepID=A0A9Q0IQC0_9TELE|nr:hypothetical protein NHX12_026499 [Muraenolepis orangiensis]